MDNDDFSNHVIDQLHKVILEYGIKKTNPNETFLLHSGESTNTYFDFRSVFSNPFGLRYAVSVIDHLRNRDIQAIGGIATSTIAIASALSLKTSYSNNPIPSFYTRAERKKYGSGRSIEGLVKRGDKVILIEDVITTGRSLINAIEICEENGLEVVETFVMVARKPIGVETVKAYKEDLLVNILYDAQELIEEYEQLQKTHKNT